jgi:hypothetical protein
MGERTLSELAGDSCTFAAMFEALGVLQHAAGGPQDCPLARRARNGFSPTLEVTIKYAWALKDQTERADPAGWSK